MSTDRAAAKYLPLGAFADRREWLRRVYLAFCLRAFCTVCIFHCPLAVVGTRVVCGGRDGEMDMS